MLWISITLGFIEKEGGLLAGIIGFETNDFLRDYIGFIGTVLVLAFFAIIYIVVRLRYTPEQISESLKNSPKVARDNESKSGQASKEQKKTIQKNEPLVEEVTNGAVIDTKEKVTTNNHLDKKEIEKEIVLTPTVNDLYKEENNENETIEKFIIKSQE